MEKWIATWVWSVYFIFCKNLKRKVGRRKNIIMAKRK